MQDNWQKKLPMAATGSRLFIAPIIYLVLVAQPAYFQWIAAVLFILGSLTDWLDGYWARKYNAESNLGKFMDPIADKILTLCVLVILIDMDRIGPAIPALLLARDIFIGGLRAVAAADQIVIAARPTGKWKTGIQMVSIPCLFVDVEYGGFSLLNLGHFGLWLSVILSLISGIQYTHGYYKGAYKK
jgi:CDP-diacylglycerol--glycerol-3-phosphate 3-phosphatidyltransferase